MEKPLGGTRRIDSGRELLVLGIIRRQPLSAYAIDHAVRSHTALYRGLGQGNVYNFVDRLAGAGYLGSRTGKAKRGPSVSKSVYHLTGKGEERFQQILQSILCDAEASDSALEIALVLLGQLRRTEASRLLGKRNKEIIAQERRRRRLFGDADRSGPANLAGSHAVYRLESERRFVADALRLLASARWHPEWS